jgi:hypothetical protein
MRGRGDVETGMARKSKALRFLTSGGSPAPAMNRKRLSRLVALARYDLSREQPSHAKAELRSKRVDDATVALADYDDLHPAEALAALESDGEQWNRPFYESRRAQLLAKIRAS